MTRNAFNMLVGKTMSLNPTLRYGQTVFSVASMELPESIVEPLRASDVDPFYDDRLAPAFMAALAAAGAFEPWPG